VSNLPWSLEAKRRIVVVKWTMAKTGVILHIDFLSNPILHIKLITLRYTPESIIQTKRHD
jgi:hypothetical protein